MVLILLGRYYTDNVAMNCLLYKVRLDHKLVSETLSALIDARITYPGKSDKAAELILDRVRSARPIGSVLFSTEL